MSSGFLGKGNNNIWILEQDQNRYHVQDKKLKKYIYVIEEKSATTRSHYFIIDKVTKKSLGNVVKTQIGSDYKILDDNGNEIGEILIGEKKVTIKYQEREFSAKPKSRFKDFEFMDKSNNLIFTVDKKTISRTDKYTIETESSVNPIISLMVALAIDDYFHSATL